jgi:catechol 2,3-dioxygenase-like lactoylglutathione lyase family enzyme
VDFQRVRLQAGAGDMGPLIYFYAAALGIERAGTRALQIGATELEFVPSSGKPFYHFALLVPGDRFEAALEWARGRTELLPDPETGDVVFDFEAWSAKALYFHDPAGNIVELIAHRGIGEAGTEGPFAPSELMGFSELGLVGDDLPRMAEQLERIDLRLWDGTLDEPGRLAFVGEPARTLILCPADRGWLPTGRPAEPHAVQATLSGPPEGSVHLDYETRIERR